MEPEDQDKHKTGLGSALAAIADEYPEAAAEFARVIAEGRGDIPRDNATILAADYWADRKRDLVMAFNSNKDIWYIAARNKNGDELLIFTGPHP